MKKLGIIGGAGPLASILLYETLVRESYRQSLIVPEIFLINYPFTRGLSCQEGKENQNLIQKELSYCVQSIMKNGADIGVLACNTLHLYLENIITCAVPFVSLPSLILNEAKNHHHQTLLLLATQNTCQSNLYQQKHSKILYPSQQDQQIIDEIIDRILEGHVCQTDSLLLSQIIEKLSSTLTFDAVILGCTDLPVLHHFFPLQSIKPIYDSIKIPAKKLREIL